jgi:hypothetical protein
MTLKQKNGDSSDLTRTQTATDVSNPGLPADDEKTEISQDNIALNAATLTGLTQTPSPTPLPSPAQSAKNRAALNQNALKNLSAQQITVDTTTNAEPIEVESYQSRKRSNSGSNKNSGGSSKQSSQRRRTSEKQSSSGFSLLFVVSIIVGGYLALSSMYPNQAQKLEDKVRGMMDLSSEKGGEILPSNPAPQGKPIDPIHVPSFLQGNDRQAATQVESIPKTVIVIQSRPSGAEIFVNDKDTNQQTPARVQVPADAKFSLRLKKDRYVDYQQDNLTVAKVNKKYEAVLQRALVAYVDIIVQPAKANARVYVNNELLQDETVPVTRYGIPAKTDVRIRAEVPTENLRAETVVNLKEDQRQTIVLKLEKMR